MQLKQPVLRFFNFPFTSLQSFLSFIFASSEQNRDSTGSSLFYPAKYIERFMKIMPWRFSIAAGMLLAVSCSTTQKTGTGKSETSDPYALQPADTVHYEIPENAVVVSASPYRSSYTIINDLVNTKLDVKFDWQKMYLYGKAWITLKPHFYPTDSLRLDARGFDIHKVELVRKSGNTRLEYDYDSSSLNIYLDKT